MKLKLLASLLAANVMLIAQNKTENLSMDASYANDLYFSLEDGLVKSEVRDNWDLAFTTQIVDASILINDVAGVNLYVGSTDTADWSNLDTTGNSWDPLYNSATSWSEGAFNAMSTGHPNYGWGNYNSVTHDVIGTKVFILQLDATTYKKIIIDAMKTNGDFNFRIYDLDGSNLVSKTINKTNYSNVNFIYYDISSNTVLNREPLKTKWDFMFTKYYDEVSPGAFYPVTGVKQNIGIAASKAAGVDTTMVDHNNFPVSDSAINIIGYDWKELTPSFTYEAVDSLSYFVETQQGNLYKVVFKSWDGSSTGDFSFATSLISAVSVPELKTLDIALYPNPAQDFIQVNTEESLVLEIHNLSGSVIISKNINNYAKIDVSQLSAGTYVVRATNNTGVYVSKLVIL